MAHATPAALLSALEHTGLGDRIALCGERRGFADNPYKFRCNLPACGRCLRRYIRIRSRWLADEFSKLPCVELVEFEVRSLTLKDDVEMAVAAFDAMRQAIRNARRGRRWSSIRACGHFSVAILGDRLTPTLRAVAHTGAIDWQELRRDLADVIFEVGVWPFGRGGQHDLADAMAQQLQFPSDVVDLKTEFYQAVYRVGGGFRPLMFSQGLRPETRSRAPISGVPETEPMPMVFGSPQTPNIFFTQGAL